MGPLRDLRVVELAGLGATPFCAMLLADLGRGRDPDRPPGLRRRRELPERAVAPARAARPPQSTSSIRDGPELVLRLVERADALVEGYRPGVAERLGVGPDACLARNERLVYGRMTGWGQTGPLRRAARATTSTYIADLRARARPRSRPPPPLNLVGDFGGGGLLLAFGIVGAAARGARLGPRAGRRRRDGPTAPRC